jgi:hypothetical protein
MRPVVTSVWALAIPASANAATANKDPATRRPRANKPLFIESSLSTFKRAEHCGVMDMSREIYLKSA